VIGYIREQWATLVIVFGAMYAIFSFGVKPAIDTHAGLAAEAVVAAEELDRLSAASSAPQQEETAARVARLLGHRFGEDTLIGEQNQIHALASDVGLRIGNVEPDSRVRSEVFGPLVLRVGQVRVSATGSYDQIASFLASIDRAPMATVEEFMLREGDEAGEVQLSLTLSTASVSDAGTAIADGEMR